MPNKLVSEDHLKPALIAAALRSAQTLLQVVEGTASRYDRYKETLRQVLDAFLSEEDRIRICKLKPGLLEIISALDTRNATVAETEGSDMSDDDAAFINGINDRLRPIADELYRIVNVNKKIRLPSSRVIAYEQAERLTSHEFAKLNVREALSFFPRTSIAAVLAAAGFYAAKYLAIVPQALAATHTPIPPPIVGAVVLIFAIVFAVVFLGILYAGFLAREKNEVAAHITGHLATFISGAVLGLLGHVPII